MSCITFSNFQMPAIRSRIKTFDLFYRSVFSLLCRSLTRIFKENIHKFQKVVRRLRNKVEEKPKNLTPGEEENDCQVIIGNCQVIIELMNCDP